MTFVPFHDADDIGDRFLALLSRQNINPPAGSSFEDELLSRKVANRSTIRNASLKRVWL